MNECQPNLSDNHPLKKPNKNKESKSNVTFENLIRNGGEKKENPKERWSMLSSVKDFKFNRNILCMMHKIIIFFKIQDISLTLQY